MRGISSKMIARAEPARDELSARLAGNPNVLGFGIGYRICRGKIVQRCSIRVHVRKKYALAVVPERRRLPTEVSGFPVDVTDGVFWPHACELRSSRFPRLMGGIMIGNRNNRPQVGTHGHRVIDRDTGEEYLLSNWHDLYGRENATDGEAVVQPRALRASANNVGETLVGEISPQVDAALARLTGSRQVSPRISGLPEDFRVTGTVRPRVGMEVVKSGVNGVARGVIDALRFRITLPYPDSIERTLEEQIHIRPSGGSTNDFCVDEGDSGSLWIEKDTGRVAGLHVGGIAMTSAIANDINIVVDTLARLGKRVAF